jgi:hypothetical protein
MVDWNDVGHSCEGHWNSPSAEPVRPFPIRLTASPWQLNEPNPKAIATGRIMTLAVILAAAIKRLLQITFAAITGDTVIYYGVSDPGIGLLSLSLDFPL